jgi:hypothetical protein
MQVPLDWEYPLYSICSTDGSDLAIVRAGEKRCLILAESEKLAADYIVELQDARMRGAFPLEATTNWKPSCADTHVE